MTINGGSSIPLWTLGYLPLWPLTGALRARSFGRAFADDKACLCRGTPLRPQQDNKRSLKFWGLVIVTGRPRWPLPASEVALGRKGQGRVGGFECSPRGP